MPIISSFPTINDGSDHLEKCQATFSCFQWRSSSLARYDPRIREPEEHLELERTLCSWLILANSIRKAGIVQVIGYVGKTQEHNDKIPNFSRQLPEAA